MTPTRKSVPGAGSEAVMPISDAELVIILAHEEGCNRYVGDGDCLCDAELDDELGPCECLRIVRVLREAIEGAASSHDIRQAGES